MIEKMNDFFDKRAANYEDHMKLNIEDFDNFYETATAQIPASNQIVNVLDLGVGTGLGLALLLPKLPRARFTLIDVSAQMLAELTKKFSSKLAQFDLVNQSYLNFEYPYSIFDYAISVQSLHHLLLHDKIELYRKIAHSLKPRGKYIEADFIVSDDLEKKYLHNYFDKIAGLTNPKASEYHLDIPFSLKTTGIALNKAGMEIAEISYQKEHAVIFTANRI
jgi:tRNA (cmo5U34)-methyltransferase